MKKFIVLISSLFLLSCSATPTATQYEYKPMRDVAGPIQRIEDLGQLTGAFGISVYKVTIDSIQYIVIDGGHGAAITKHKSLTNDSK